MVYSGSKAGGLSLVSVQIMPPVKQVLTWNGFCGLENLWPSGKLCEREHMAFLNGHWWVVVVFPVLLWEAVAFHRSALRPFKRAKKCTLHLTFGWEVCFCFVFWLIWEESRCTNRHSVSLLWFA